MNEAPSWVVTAVGLYAVLGSAFFVLLIVVLGLLFRALLDVGRHVKAVSTQVHELTDRVKGIAEKVDTVTTQVGTRANGIVELVDDRVEPALRAVELVAPVLFVVGAFFRLRSAVLGRRRRR